MRSFCMYKLCICTLTFKSKLAPASKRSEGMGLTCLTPGTCFANDQVGSMPYYRLARAVPEE